MTPHVELEVVLVRGEGALVRLLGTVERRGFMLQGVQTREDANDAGRVVVALELLGARDVGVLCRQIERLFEVERVVILV
jgi:acetolactate synthase regulatory subunit